MGWFRRRKKEDDEEISRMVVHAAEIHGVSSKDVVDTVLDDEEEEDELYEEHGKRHSKAGLVITCIIVGGIFGLVVVVLMKLANAADASGPTTNTILQQAQASLAPSASPSNATAAFTGVRIAFEYPALFDIQRVNTHYSSDESYTFDSTASYQQQITVNVAKQPNGDWKDDSSYMYRALHSDLYKPTSSIVHGEPATIMVKNDGSEQTLYWPHAGMLVIVSATSTKGGIDLGGYLKVIAGNMKWLQ